MPLRTKQRKGDRRIIVQNGRLLITIALALSGIIIASSSLLAETRINFESFESSFVLILLLIILAVLLTTTITMPILGRQQKKEIQQNLQKSQEELRQSNETLRAIFEACPHAIMIIDNKSNIKMWNKGAERVFGWSEAEVLNVFDPLIPEHKKKEHTLIRERAFSGDVTLFNTDFHKG